MSKNDPLVEVAGELEAYKNLAMMGARGAEDLPAQRERVYAAVERYGLRERARGKLEALEQVLGRYHDLNNKCPVCGLGGRWGHSDTCRWKLAREQCQKEGAVNDGLDEIRYRMWRFQHANREGLNSEQRGDELLAAVGQAIEDRDKKVTQQFTGELADLVGKNERLLKALREVSEEQVVPIDEMTEECLRETLRFKMGWAAAALEEGVDEASTVS